MKLSLYRGFIICVVLLMVSEKGWCIGYYDSIIVSRIWGEGTHNAFTDLIRFKKRFYCSFREGEGHVGTQTSSGKVRILSSKDAVVWESVAVIELPGIDLRDPKLSVTPDNKIMVIMAGATFDATNFLERLFPVVSFSNTSGTSFSAPENVVLDPAIQPRSDWAWRVTWHNGTGYTLNYQLKENQRDRSRLPKDAWLLYLMKTTDGKYFEKVSQLEVEDLPNEATVRFDENNTAYALVRKEAGDRMGVLAKATSPYTSWQYAPLNYRLGGPNFIFFEKDKLIVGSRLYEPSAHTAILLTDLNGKALKTIRLPSGGDNSYPGLLIYKKKLWVSYYSGHEGKTQIYLAKIPLSQFKQF